MRVFCQRFTIAAAALAAGSAIGPGGAQADAFVMPYECRVQAGAVVLQPSAEATYRIIGQREEQPFTACAAASSSCETMMVHRFQFSCGGEKIGSSRLADAARKAGIAMPQGLPAGFTPVGPLAGRFIFPALTTAGKYVAPGVDAQTLSADSVRTATAEADIESAGWRTKIKAEVVPSEAGGRAGAVAAVLAAALLLFSGVSLAVARRQKLHIAGTAAMTQLVRLRHRMQQTLRDVAAKWQAGQKEPGEDALGNALAMAYARLAEVELTVAGLPQDLLLRDVLLGEIDRARPRIAVAEKDMHRRPAEKSAAIIRMILKELERIQRIAQSAAVSTRADAGARFAETFEIPGSVAEAYRVLGINPDAAPAAAKKLIDALRLSWHPDHARDAEDRARREGRMKQINAAWDIINGRRAAA